MSENTKIHNPYKPRSVRWALMEEDFSDLTAKQIAEVFDMTQHSIFSTMRQIKQRTGFEVPYKRVRGEYHKRQHKDCEQPEGES